MDNHVDHVINIATKTGYGVSSSLILGDMLQFMNHNAAAFGVMLGFATYVTQVYFSRLKHRAYLATLTNNNCSKCGGRLATFHSRNKYICYDCEAQFPMRKDEQL